MSITVVIEDQTEQIKLFIKSGGAAIGGSLRKAILKTLREFDSREQIYVINDAARASLDAWLKTLSGAEIVYDKLYKHKPKKRRSKESRLKMVAKHSRTTDINLFETNKEYTDAY
jgi:hypothetical protein